MKHQKGLSLIELMISLTLGIVLMTGVMQMFLTSRVTYSTQQAISRVQETGRMAMHYLTEDIRMAGYMGCSSRNSDITYGLESVNDDSEYMYSFDEAIYGYSAADFPDNDIAPTSNTEVVVVRRASSGSTHVTHMDPNNANMDISGPVENNCLFDGELCAGDIALISDCSKGRVFRSTGISEGSGGLGFNVSYGRGNSGGGSLPKNIDTKLGGQEFQPGAEVLSLNTITYYVAPSNFTEVNSLWKKVGEDSSVELVEGVENMRVFYGLDSNSNGVPDTYRELSSMGTADWSHVQAVRIHLLVVSPKTNVVPDSLKVSFAGTDTTIDDRRMGHVFTSTVAVRNRLNQ